MASSDSTWGHVEALSEAGQITVVLGAIEGADLDLKPD